MNDSELLKCYHELRVGINELQHRATGRSTQLVDKYIQDLFNHPDEWIEVYDHWPTQSAAHYLAHRIRFRLEKEHHLDADVTSIKGGYAMKLKGYHKADCSEQIAEKTKEMLALKEILIEKGLLKDTD